MDPKGDFVKNASKIFSAIAFGGYRGSLYWD
jgi:hypothetical protein